MTLCKVIGYDSFSELPGIHLGTWTVRSAMLRTKRRKKTISLQYSETRTEYSALSGTRYLVLIPRELEVPVGQIQLRVLLFFL